MNKPPSGRPSPNGKFEVPLQTYELIHRGIWSPRPIVHIPVVAPLRPDAVLSPAHVEFLVDTGADITVIPRRLADDIYRLEHTRAKSFAIAGVKTSITLKDGTKQRLSTEGYLNHLTILLCGVECKIPYVVAYDDDLPLSVLGRAGVVEHFRVTVGGGLLTIEPVREVARPEPPAAAPPE